MTVGGVFAFALWLIKYFSINIRVFFVFGVYSMLKMKYIAINITRAVVISSTSQTFSPSIIISRIDSTPKGLPFIHSTGMGIFGS